MGRRCRWAFRDSPGSSASRLPVPPPPRGSRVACDRPGDRQVRGLLPPRPASSGRRPGPARPGDREPHRAPFRDVLYGLLEPSPCRSRSSWRSRVGILLRPVPRSRSTSSPPSSATRRWRSSSAGPFPSAGEGRRGHPVRHRDRDRGARERDPLRGRSRDAVGLAARLRGRAPVPRRAAVRRWSMPPSPWHRARELPSVPRSSHPGGLFEQTALRWATVGMNFCPTRRARRVLRRPGLRHALRGARAGDRSRARGDQAAGLRGHRGGLLRRAGLGHERCLQRLPHGRTAGEHDPRRRRQLARQRRRQEMILKVQPGRITGDGVDLYVVRKPGTVPAVTSRACTSSVRSGSR